MDAGELDSHLFWIDYCPGTTSGLVSLSAVCGLFGQMEKVFEENFDLLTFSAPGFHYFLFVFTAKRASVG